MSENVKAMNELARLPAHEFNEDAIARGLELTNAHLASVGLRPEPDYKSAVLTAMRKNGSFVLRVNPSFIDEDIAAEISPVHIPWVVSKKGHHAYDLFSRVQIDKCVHLDINLISDLDPAYVSDDLIKDVIKTQPARRADAVEKAGRLNIINELIAEGYWPSRSSGVPAKPADLEEAIKSRLSKKWDGNESMWLNALIRSYPENEVFPLMKTTSRKKILLEVYDRDVLLKDHKSDKKLMGLLLENELGL